MAMSPDILGKYENYTNVRVPNTLNSVRLWQYLLKNQSTDSTYGSIVSESEAGNIVDCFI